MDAYRGQFSPALNRLKRQKGRSTSLTCLFAIFTTANLPKQVPPSLPSLFSSRTGFNERFPNQGGLLSLLNDYGNG